MRSGVDDARFWNLEGLDARHPSPRYTQLPDAPELVQRIRERAQEVTSESDNDLDRVRDVIAHFHTEYNYSLAAQDTPGLEGVLAFLDDKRGHCTDFASASALLLRSIGISSRIATGFLVDEWSDEEDAFEVTTRDGHAWLEVWFEEVGWLRLEPTPSGRREQAWRMHLAEGQPGLATWFEELGTDLSYWLSSGTDEADLELVMLTLGQAPEALWASARRSPLAFAAWLLALGGAWYVLVARRRPRDRSRSKPASAELARDEDLYAKLLRALEKRGQSRRASQTPREFAAKVAGDHPEWRALIDVTEAFYKARFGDVELEPAEVQALESLTRTVGSEARAVPQ